MTKSILTILVYALITGAISYAFGKTAGLDWQIGFVPIVALGAVVLGMWLPPIRRQR